MKEDDRRRRAVAAQGFAAIALFVFAHSARAATPPTQPTPAHACVACQLRAA